MQSGNNRLSQSQFMGYRLGVVRDQDNNNFSNGDNIMGDKINIQVNIHYVGENGGIN